MRHRVAYRKLGRVTDHRIAMLRNQATALLRYEHLTTTVPRAKELRPFVERLITIAKRGVAGGETNGHELTARRLVMQDLQDRAVVAKLFETLAPRFAERPGGYTRLLRIGFRKGDSAEVAQVELGAASSIPARRTRPRQRARAPNRRPKASADGSARPPSGFVAERSRNLQRASRRKRPKRGPRSAPPASRPQAARLVESSESSIYDLVIDD